METSHRGWTARRRPTGFPGGVFLAVAAVVGLVVLAVLAALGLLVMALVGLLMGADRLVATLVPAYRRRRDRRVTMPAGLVRIVRFGSGSGSGSGQVVDARSYERPGPPPRPGGTLEP